MLEGRKSGIIRKNKTNIIIVKCKPGDRKMRQEIDAIIEKEVERRFESRVGRIFVKQTEMIGMINGELREIKALVADIAANLQES